MISLRFNPELRLHLLDFFSLFARVTAVSDAHGPKR